MAYTILKKRKASLRKLAHDEAPITFEKFYKLAEESKKYDLIDGKIIRDAPVIDKHGRVVAWLIRALGNYVEQFDLAEVLTAPVTVRLSNYQGRQPDVLFVSKERKQLCSKNTSTARPIFALKWLPLARAGLIAAASLCSMPITV